MERTAGMGLLRSLFVFGVWAWHAASAFELSPEEERGQVIYRTGKSPSGDEIPTFLGDAGAAIPSHLFACANCHGPDGKGLPEGGIIPSNITWHELSKPYGAVTGNHRRRPPYKEAQILTAIRKGIDPGGNRLETAMPRYQLSDEDGNALIAYLKVIHRVRDPGVFGGRIRIGVVLPPVETAKAEAKAMEFSLNSYFGFVNRDGGIYRRQVELVFLRLEEPRSNWTEQWTRFLEREPVFALLGPYLAGSEVAAIDELISRFRIPTLAPLVDAPQMAELPNPNVFYFYPGIAEQMQALIQFAQESLGIRSDETLVVGESGALLEGYSGLNRLSVEERGDLSALFEQSEAGPGRAVLIAGSESDCVTTLTALSRGTEFPAVLLPSTALTAKSEPYALRYPGDVFVGAGYRALGGAEAVNVRKSTLIVADTFRSLLLEMGRSLSRRKLIALLEQFNEVQSNWTGPLTFSPNRRIGPRGAYIGKLGEGLKSWEDNVHWVELKD